MTQYHYHLVDVFTDHPFGGNQLAVFTDATGLDGKTMQRIAKELNLAETSFVLPPQDPANDFHVRIFTPAKEMPMAGHPTVGTAYVLHHAGIVKDQEQIIFEEGVGPITVTYRTDAAGKMLIEMQQPLPEFGPVFSDRQIIADMLSLRIDDLRDDLPIQTVSTGVPFLYIPIKTLAAMRKIEVRVDLWQLHLKHHTPSELFVFSMEVENPTSTVHSRMFAPGFGIPEDPATGAASGPLGAYLVHHSLVSSEQAGSIISEQGIEMGRPSFIHIAISQTNGTITDVRIAGHTQAMGAGALELEIDAP